MSHNPHIVMVIPRGEAVRNFLYSDTLKVLSENARVTLLSVIHDEAFRARFEPVVDRIIPLEEYPERIWVKRYRLLVHNVHFRWLNSGAARWRFEYHDAQMVTLRQKALRKAWKALVRVLANRPTLNRLGEIERFLTLRFRTTDYFNHLFEELKPDLVFNTSHIHGHASDLPMRVAYSMGIPTAGFIFSWDNLTSRSRIYVPYNYYLVWHERMRDQLLSIYPEISPDRVFITGTPQFDYHFKQEYWLTREQLAQQIGIDPTRPFVLYTAGIDRHFPKEHLMVELVARLLNELGITPKPQLVVRTYVKGTSAEMRALAQQNHRDILFPPVMWDDKWFMPAYEDLAIYTSLIRETSLGINAASTVSLELLMLDKPVINLGFDPPGSNLPRYDRYSKHVDEFDHYVPVTNSGAVMVARSAQDMATMLRKGLTEPQADSARRQAFVSGMFGNTLDGGSGGRAALCLLELLCASH